MSAPDTHGSMRKAADIRLPVALTIAGSDSGGGAGIQADLKTFEALGVFGTSAVTAVTAQNTQRVTNVQEVEPEVVRDQIDAVVDDLKPAAAKTGMLSSAPIIEVVAEAMETHELRTVIDPVMVAKSGDRLLRPDAEAALRERLLPLAEVLTPNAPEAEALTGRSIRGPDDLSAVLGDLMDLGPQAVLLKGGHLEGDVVTDLLQDSDGVVELRKPRFDTKNTHGTGCTLSAAVAAGLAKGLELRPAVQEADALLERGIRYGLALGAGHGPVHHMARVRNDVDRTRVLIELATAVDRFVQADLVRLLPEIGTNLAVATSYAMRPEDVAAVRGRIVAVTSRDGTPRARAVGEPAFGASQHVASLLLAVRAHDPQVGAAINLRHGPDVDAALETMGWDVARFDRSEEPDAVKRREGGTLPWAGHRVMRDRQRAPQAVVDAGEVGKEAIVRLLGPDAAAVVDAARELEGALPTDGPQTADATAQT